MSDLNSDEPRVVYLVRGAEDVSDRDTIDVASVIRKVWSRRWWLVAATLLAAIAAVAYAMLATPVYRAEVTLLPRQHGGGLSLPGQLSSLGGLAGLAGLSVGGGDKQEPMGVLQSFGFVRRFIEANGLTELLTGVAQEKLGGSEGPMDSRKAAEFFARSVMTVTEQPKTGLISIAVEWRDGAQAAAWANGLARQVNEEMRQRALVESEAVLKYLTAQLESTRNVALQQSIARLIEAEMQKLMLANGTQEFAFRVVDEAEVPRLRIWPKRTLIAIAGTLAGFLFGLVLVFLADPIRRAFRAAFA